MKQKTSYIIGAVVVLGLIAYFVSKGSDAPQQNNNSNKPSQQNQTQNAGSGSESAAGTELTGILRISDNRKQGNLMLETADGKPFPKIYLTTSRDFGALVDKGIVVKYEGNLSDFTLKDIVAK